MDMQLEEGEISDCSEESGINPYIPLERPVLHFEPVCRNGNENPAMEEDATSSSQVKHPGLMNSDSESDDELNYSKRLKLSAPAKSKYNIWNKDPDGGLTDFLNQVGMDEKGAFEDHRNVENDPLPFKMCNKFNNSNSQSKKRKIAKRRKIAIRRKYIQEPREDLKKVTRNLDLLDVNESNTIEEVAEDITKKLRECNQELILRIVIALGKDKAIQLFEKTRVIEKLGGMPIANGARKRTSGGVFIFLVRTEKDLSEDKLKAIFKAMNKIKKKRKGKHLRRAKNKKISSELSNPPPSPNLPELPQRKDVLTELLDQQKDITGALQRDDDDELISFEDVNFPELV